MSDFVFIPNFLKMSEAHNLKVFVDFASFIPGRQGTGYEKASLIGFKDLIARSLKAMKADENNGSDAYLLRYFKGSFIASHKDDAPFGSQHLRLNAMVQEAEKGGIFKIDGKAVDFPLGSAIVFRPDEIEHEVTVVEEGERLVLSVGVLM